MAKNTRLRIQKDLEKSLVPSSLILTDANNEAGYLGVGTEGQLLQVVSGVAQWNTPASTAISISDGVNTQTVNAGDTILVEAGSGMSVLVGATDKITYSVKLSADLDNAASIGTDGGVFVNKAQLVSSVTWDDATNNIVITFANGSVVSVPIVDNIASFLSDFSITDGVTTTLINNHGTVTYTANNLLKVTVSGSTVTYGIDPTGSTAGQYIESTGATTAPIWKKPLQAVKDEFETTALTVGASTVTLTSTPSTVGEIVVIRNGQELMSSDYSVSGATVTFVEAFGASSGAVFSETVIVKYYI